MVCFRYLARELYSQYNSKFNTLSSSQLFSFQLGALSITSAIHWPASHSRLMAFNTHSRRDLYATSEPRPKDFSKRRNGSPPKKTSSHKTSFKKSKKMSKEEISVRTYKSISLLLDAARVLDEEEKKASTPSPLVKTKVKSAAKKASSSKPAPSSMDISPVAPPPVATVPPPPQSPIKLIHDDHQYTASTTISSSFDLFNDHRSSSTTVHTQPLEESPLAKIESLAPSTIPLSASTLESLSISVPEATVPLLSPLPPTLRPSDDAMTMHRPVAALPIPAELRDIALPIAHRSVSTVTRVVATKTPRKPRGPNKKKPKTHAQITEEAQLVTNFGYPNECRTRIPPALRRYWDRLERQKRQREVFFHDYFWQ
ncbi:hypothetical protein PRIPAC_95564 [Pristionchus pacificus]|uniref:Uncharacterized protein n=1 Tax=Pristionchus pacificus TaxID=54126 RepID=A0A2A6BCS7_PRIPA|nr:hypothetical protein PRIPAC_95564 [Pristionchus pacificus]|eukprot:PDM63685.1 hypothetical protein PRIPAC_49658 [Pristionchus pacificus]